MKYLIEYNNCNLIGGMGDWVSLCPVCGLHLNIDFMDFNMIYQKGKFWNKNKNKIISNFEKFNKLQFSGDSFVGYEDYTILLPNSIIKHNVRYEGENNFENYGEVFFKSPYYDKNGTKGLPMHTECWELAKEKFNHELKFEDFAFNNNLKIKNGNKDNKSSKKSLISDYNSNYLYFNGNDAVSTYGDVLKYSSQYWNDNFESFLVNEDDWYLLYLPIGDSREAKKNSKRIEKILDRIIKGIIKNKPSKSNLTKKLKFDRPSPSESATEFKEGTKKKGNDGNMYVVAVNKNGVKRWKKL